MSEVIEGQTTLYDFIGPGPCVRDPFKEFDGMFPSSAPMILDDWFQKILTLLPGTDFWYLAGPMTDVPKLNFPEFDRIAALLRAQKYSIVSPAEFEHEAARQKILEGDAGPAWADCLARDVTVVSHPQCIGIIAIDGWMNSEGALLETHVADRLAKPIMEFSENPLTLTQVARSARVARV